MALWQVLICVMAIPTGFLHVAGISVGIDLGTTYSCAAIYKSGNVDIVPNEQGNRITPSWVAITPEGERLVGEAAKNQAVGNPKNTVYDIKRLIGRQFDDKEVQQSKAVFPFDVVSKDRKPAVKLHRLGVDLVLTAEEVSALILEKMKQITEDFIGAPITEVVVTVPAYFNDAQRQATKDAGRIAGLNVIKVLNEPTAAAIAYGLDQNVKSKKVLVFDLGGGTFDVSLLAIDKGEFRVLATSGDTHLGGSDFDQKIIEWLISRFELKHERDLKKSPVAMAKLRREAEKAKRLLSTEMQVTIDVEAIMDNKDLSETLTRAKFESLCKDMFKSTTEPIKKVLRDTDTRPLEVENIVLVGGSTRIPYIRELVKTIFGGREPVTGVNPDEAIAYGAAVQAAMLSGEKMKQKVTLYDVTPLSLGIRTSGGAMANLINRNTPVPAKKEKTFSTSRDNQKLVSVEIYEGERTLVKDNHFLGKFDLVLGPDVPLGPRGSHKFQVTFNIDDSGLLHVSAYHIGYGTNTKNLTIDSESNRLSEEEISTMLANALVHREQDKLVSDTIDSRRMLEQQALKIRVYMANPSVSDGIEDIAENITAVDNLVTNVIHFLSSNLAATKAECDERRSILTALAQPVLDYIREVIESKELSEDDTPTTDGESDTGGGENDEEGTEHTELWHFF